MTNIYFIRHAEPDYTNHNDMERPLTQKGKEDSKLVTRFLHDKNIDIVLSSPFKRAVDTIKDFADVYQHNIFKINDFRERRVDSGWIEDFNEFSKMQWSDFNYKLSDGESLLEVQNRNVAALLEVVSKYHNKNIVIGSHGTALSTIIQYFKTDFGFEDFQKIKYLMPWIVKFSFDEDILVDIETFDILAKIRKAVGAVLITLDSKILLIHKSCICNENGEKIDVDFWDFVKGGVHENETKEQAIIREIYEETGMESFDSIEEIEEKIYFEFPLNLSNIIGFDRQETTMYLVKLNKSLKDLRCEDEEIDKYSILDMEAVYDVLSHIETKIFWENYIKRNLNVVS